MQAQGYKIIPVNPTITEALGGKSFASIPRSDRSASRGSASNGPNRRVRAMASSQPAVPQHRKAQLPPRPPNEMPTIMRLRALEGLDGTKSPPSRWTSPQMPAAEVTAEATRLRDDYYGRIGTTSPEQLRQVSSGRQSLEEYGISVPRSYQLYLALGRFRNALLLDEVARRPTPALEAFIYAHRLQGYRPAEPSVTARRPSLFDPATSTH